MSRPISSQPDGAARLFPASGAAPRDGEELARVRTDVADATVNCHTATEKLRATITSFIDKGDRFRRDVGVLVPRTIGVPGRRPRLDHPQPRHDRRPPRSSTGDRRDRLGARLVPHPLRRRQAREAPLLPSQAGAILG